MIEERKCESGDCLESRERKTRENEDDDHKILQTEEVLRDLSFLCSSLLCHHLHHLIENQHFSALHLRSCNDYTLPLGRCLVFFNSRKAFQRRFKRRGLFKRMMQLYDKSILLHSLLVLRSCSLFCLFPFLTIQQYFGTQGKCNTSSVSLLCNEKCIPT